MILCLDFDGVIADSINETLVVSTNAYYAKDQSNWIDIDDIDPKIITCFKKNRYLVAPARDFYVIHRIIETDGYFDRFNTLKADCSSEILDFEKRYFAFRKFLREEHKQKWLSYHILHKPVEKLIKSFTGDKYIITTKDLQSVLELCDYWKITKFIKAFYTKENLKSKRLALIDIFRKSDKKWSDFIFVDDNVEYFEEMGDISPIKCLALWGYVKPSYIAPPDIKCCSLDEMEPHVFRKIVAAYQNCEI